MNEQSVPTLAALITVAAEEFGDRPALSFVDEQPWSYNEVYQAAAALSVTLTSQGIKQGDRVALLSESSPRWGIAYFAGVLCGAIMVPILPDFHTTEVDSILDHSGASCLLVSEKMQKKLSDTAMKLPVLVIEQVIVRPEVTSDVPVVNIPEISEDDTVCIIYTSGTTGSSKGVMLSHKNILVNAFAARKIPNWTEETHALSVLPLAHTYEFTIGFIILLTIGGTIHYMRRPPSTSVLIPALAKVRPQIMLSVPLLIEKIFEGVKRTKIDNRWITRNLYKLPLTRKVLNKVIGKGLMKTFGDRIHFFGIGGAPLARETERFLREANFPFSIGYGLTETSPLIAGGLSPDIPFNSTGPVMPGIEYKLVADAESRHTDKELYVRGPSVMKGYYHDPQKTAEVLSEDGWFRTGDLGRISADGSLTITGRAKNMILGSNGENIYPDQIEAIINQDQYVLESLVVQDPKTKNLVAKVLFDYERFIEQHKESRIVKEFHQLERQLMQKKEVNLQDQVNTYLHELVARINKELSAFSRIGEVIEQKEPFVRTPTKKIKRYLYEL